MTNTRTPNQMKEQATAPNEPIETPEDDDELDLEDDDEDDEEYEEEETE